MFISQVVANEMFLVNEDFEFILFAKEVEEIGIPKLERTAVYVHTLEPNDNTPAEVVPVLFRN